MDDIWMRVVEDLIGPAHRPHEVQVGAAARDGRVLRDPKTPAGER
jgi:hypothetical protein